MAATCRTKMPTKDILVPILSAMAPMRMRVAALKMASVLTAVAACMGRRPESLPCPAMWPMTMSPAKHPQK
jgi:hypothetical protein